MGISDQLTKHFRTATLLGAGLISAAGVTDQAQAQNGNYYRPGGFSTQRGPGYYGGAGAYQAQQWGQANQAAIDIISSQGRPSDYGMRSYPPQYRNDQYNPSLNNSYQNPYLNQNFNYNQYNGRNYGQNLSRPSNTYNSRNQNNASGVQIRTPGFQGNFQGQAKQYTPGQTPSQRNSNQSDLNTSARIEQINSAKTSANGDFKYILNLLKEDSQGKLYYSSTHMIIPLNHKLIFMDENTRNPNVNLTKTREHNAQVDKNMAEAIRHINKETNSTMVNYMEKTNSGGKPYYLLSAREFKQATSSAGSNKASSSKITRCCCN